jgi:hypothetical protein
MFKNLAARAPSTSGNAVCQPICLPSGLSKLNLWLCRHPWVCRVIHAIYVVIPAEAGI